MEKDKKFHSVLLSEDKCKGCTHCLRRCPTEAIRIRDGKAVIKSERCIDCGECIRLCPYSAKKARFDDFVALKNYKWKIAMPAPALFGQFDNLEDMDIVLTAFLKLGFDDVYEVACAAEKVSEFTRQYIKRPDVVKPVISSACPVIVRLIKNRFPTLYKNILPVLPPVEIAARDARKKAMKEHPEFKKEDIGIFFISPCPAKVSYAKSPLGVKKSDIDAVLSMSETYFRLIPEMNKTEIPETLSNTGLIGISWAGTGGESSALFNDRYLAADGIENVIKVLDEIENDNISSLEFIELNACNGGCVGGVLTVENPYIAKARLQSLKRYLPVSRNHVIENGGVVDDKAFEKAKKNYIWTQSLEYTPVNRLSDDKVEAMKILAEIEALTETLPKLDCGSCGSPTCQAFAEDIIKGSVKIVDCVILMRQGTDNKKQKGTEQK